MPRLILAFFHALAGPWWHLGLLLAVFLAAALSFDASLGAHSLGTYLGYISLLPTALLFRLGWLLQKRQREGWPEEEVLRDPRGRRAPLAEFLATTLLLLEILLLAWIPILSQLFTLPAASSGLYPLEVEVLSVEELQAAGIEDPQGDTLREQWRFDLGGRVPEGTRLQLTLDWGDSLMPAGMVRIQAPDGRQLQPQPGRLLRWDLSTREARYGRLVLMPNPDSGLVLRETLCRMEIPRPTPGRLPTLLAQQGLFFLPLLAVLLALFRFAHIHGTLSALTSFTLGSLAAMQLQPVDLGSGPLAGLAKMLLVLKLSLPPIEGLLATGQRFERVAGTTSLSSILAWSLVGFLALFLATRRRPPRA